MSFNPVMRADPNRMVRVNRTSMQASFVAGNQRPGAQISAQRRRVPPPQPPLGARPTQSRDRTQSSNPAANPAIEIANADDFDEAQLRAVSVLPRNLTVVRGEPVVLRVEQPGAFNIDWRAYSQLNDDARQVFGGTVPFVEDFPIVDTTYEVRYQVRHGDDLRLRIVGERYRAHVRVLDNPDEPTTGLRLSETGNGLANVVSLADGESQVVQWFSYRVANRGKVPLDEIHVQLEVPIDGEKLLLNDPEARKHAPNTTWTLDRQAQTLTMSIGDLKVGEAVDVAVAIVALPDRPRIDIDRARAWSETEDRARAAVGLKRL